MPMPNENFLNQFLKISSLYTIFALLLLFGGFYILYWMKERKSSFSKRILVGLVLGLAFGLFFDRIGHNEVIYESYAQQEISVWLRFFGNGFLKLLQVMAIPVVFLSIIHVITEVQAEKIKQLTSRTFFVLLGTTAISAVVGIVVVNLFQLTTLNFAGNISEQKLGYMEEVASQSFPEFFLNLVPDNLLSPFTDNGKIVSVVLIAALFASALRFLKAKESQEAEQFLSGLTAIRTVIHSVLMNILKWMPYGVFALVAETIIAQGIGALGTLMRFILAIYTAIIMMLLIYCVLLLFVGVSPLQFYKKSYSTMVFAFSSRSSVGTLPYTLTTLKEELGVSEGSADFVATLGTTVGMNGCAGIFPAMLAVLVANSAGVELSFSFYIFVVCVVTLGSIGIAGVPGTATVAATVTLNGLGFASFLPNIGAIFGIDPLVDMGRTALNVTGSMVSAIIVDRWDKTMDMDQFHKDKKSKQRKRRHKKGKQSPPRKRPKRKLEDQSSK